jgi:hypothetical protein
MALSLVKHSDQMYKIFEQPLKNRVNLFDYDVNILDIALKKLIVTDMVEDIYNYKLLNKKLKENKKDKICALIFNSIANNSIKSEKYSENLNALTLLNKNVLNKYLKRAKEVLSEEKIEEIEKLCSFVKLKANLVVKDEVIKRHKL